MMTQAPPSRRRCRRGRLARRVSPPWRYERRVRLCRGYAGTYAIILRDSLPAAGEDMLHGAAAIGVSMRQLLEASYRLSVKCM